MKGDSEADATNIAANLLKELLESYRKQYEELCSDWRAIESKAQATVTIAGVFVAAIFAFLNQLTEQTILIQKVLLALSLLGLVFSVLLSVLALKVDKVLKAPLGEEKEELVMDLLALSDSDAEIKARIPRLQYDQLEGWKEANKSLFTATQKKANRVFRSQVVLVATLFLIGALATTFVFRAPLIHV